MEISIDADVLGQNPTSLEGLVAHFDAGLIKEDNGSLINLWSDISGNGRDLNQVRGNPILLENNELGGKQVIHFDGFSQLYSSFDFGTLLGEYSIFAVARHAGVSDEAVISSVGSDWIFGLGNNYSVYWKLGSNYEFSGSPSDDTWHVYAGTFDAGGNLQLWRNGYSVIQESLSSLSDDQKPRRLAIGGSQANSHFSVSEVGEVIIYDRPLTNSELDDLSGSLASKWLGGSLQNFPLLVRLGTNYHPDFSSSSFADSATGGDLRFFDEKNRPLDYEVERWDPTGESIIWVQTQELGTSSRFFARWGNDQNATSPTPSPWTGYEGVWHFGDQSDSSSQSRDGVASGTVSYLDSNLMGSALSLDGSGKLSTPTFNGIAGDNPRSVSLWVKSSDQDGNLVSWGSSGNYWQLSWNDQGPYVSTGNSLGVRQGSTVVSNDQWHHLLISFPGSGADLNQSRIYVNGELVDAPGSSVSGAVNTILGGSGVQIGASYDGTNLMNGSLDELRISSSARGKAWANFSYKNQKRGSNNLLRYDIEHLLPPDLADDINVTVVSGEYMEFQVRSNPPATSYSVTSQDLPDGLTFNTANGILSGTPSGTTGTYSISLTATNAQGSASTTLNISYQATLGIPVISPGEVSVIEGRSASITGQLLDTGGKINQVTLYFGKSEEGESPTNWDQTLSLGSFLQGEIPYKFENLDSGETYFYRLKTNNTTHTSWSEANSFTTLSFDQGILKFHTGLDETGSGSGLYWDKEDGNGEQKIANAYLENNNFIAPDGSAWSVSKATFSFNGDLLIGPNLNEVILTGANPLSIQVDGNVTISKHLVGATPLAAPYIQGGTVLDGHDAFYTDDKQKGNLVGQGNLGGYSGGQGPGKGFSLGTSGAGGLSGGGGSFGGEGGPGASGPSGQNYGSGGLDMLLGGSGGGFGNFGDAAAGGGAIEIVASGNIKINPEVKISMNGGSVFVNPLVGANFSGGAGSGGSIRLVGATIDNQGTLEVKGGDSSGMDPRENGARFLTNAGGAGGGGRVALIADGEIKQGIININGGIANGDSAAGQTGTLVLGPLSYAPPVDLNLDSGNLIFDTSGFWRHSSGLHGRGTISEEHFFNGGKKWGYRICQFDFNNFVISSDVVVTVKGENSPFW